MRTSIKFKEYIWLVNTIRKAGKISFADLQKKWLDTDMSEGLELQRSTFNRHKDAIEDIFGIYIECERRNGYTYYIGNEDVLAEESVQNWMLSTLSVSNDVGESLSLQDRILLESIPSEYGRLGEMTEAMKKRVCLRMTYKKYGNAEPKVVTLEPYCIKLFKRRWYVFGRLHDEEGDCHRIYSFDRIKEIELTDLRYDLPTDFSAKELFRDYYGILLSHDTEAERIVVRAYGNERFYVRDLPMHHSQQEIGEGEGYADFELRMHATSDFCSHVLSRSNQLQVLEPAWLVKKIKEMLLDALERYGDFTV
ncbi:MAG: WYL domain-containing protein [Bacteroidaceae bacterium]|nr:WYL domain-containing protein [Bacteroidaceae bacterium]